ncbi:MAG: hypothetical protein H6825_01530 [Planctomycetes bacterium]|nr:hypothetical protein [Planctomycetota bacterium]
MTQRVASLGEMTLEATGVPFVTSGQVGILLVLLTLAASVAFVWRVRASRGRALCASAASAAWMAHVLVMHFDAGSCVGCVPLIPALLLAANAAAFLALFGVVPRSLVGRLGWLLLAAWTSLLVLVVQVVALGVVEEGLSPWTFRWGDRVVLSLENELDVPASVDWRAFDDDPASALFELGPRSDGRQPAPRWLGVGARETRRALHVRKTLDDSFDAPPEATIGTLLVRVGDGPPLSVPVRAPPAAHVAARIDPSGAVWLRTGVDGCFGAPSFGDERRVGDVPSAR